MYIYLFGIESLRMYDLIGFLGYIVLVLFFIVNKKHYYFDQSLPEQSQNCPRCVTLALLLGVHVMAYTFGGSFLGSYVGRATEFFGYVAVSALGTVLTAVMLGFCPLRWLDHTVPLYLSLAAMLKLSCFCGGCCYGMPWASGWFNQRNDRMEFPIQLVEAVAYAMLLLLFLHYRGRNGKRFALFLMEYAAVRFVIQFFRADVAVFTAFHWMSAVFFIIGAVMWLVCSIWHRKKECFT